MLELDGRLGYAAVNIGRREAEFSMEEIRRAAADSPVPLISTNLVNEEGEPVLPGHLVVTVEEARIAVVGAVTEAANTGRGLKVADPIAAIRAELARLPKERDLTILLSALDVSEMERVLGEVDGIDLVLGGYIPRGSDRLEALSGTPCFLVQGKGQYLGEVDLAFSEEAPAPVTGRRIVLGPEVRSESAIEARIRAFQRSLGDLDLLGRREPGSPYIGAVACAACHGTPHEAWGKTRHADALSSLRPEKGLFDPQCLKCHTTAPGGGGYVSKEESPEHAGVGCESCHGPSRAHAEAPLTAVRPRTSGSPAETCRTCHTPDHSKEFKEAERLSAVRHDMRESD